MRNRLTVILALVLALCFACTPVLAAGSNSGDNGDPSEPETPRGEVKVRRVEVSVPTMRMYVNQTRRLWVLVTPTDADDQQLYWESSNPEVAEVYANGTVVAVSPGTATITVRSGNNKSDTCTVTVSGSVLQGVQEDVQPDSLYSAALSSGEVLTAAAIRPEVEAAVRAAFDGNAVVTQYDKSTVSTAALRAAAYTAEQNGGAVKLRVVTPRDVSDDVTYFFATQEQQPAQGWIVLDPALAGEDDRNIGLRVVTDTTENAGLINMVSRKLGGRSFCVVNLSHGGSFNMLVEIAANLQTPMQTSALRLYSYDAVTERFTPLENQGYTVDANGFVHFYTTQGGAIVITDQPIE